MPSIYDIAMEARLQKIPPTPKPYRCMACEESAKPYGERDDSYHLFHHNSNCGGDNYARYQWSWQDQRWINTEPSSSGGGMDDSTAALVALCLVPLLPLVGGLLSGAAWLIFKIIQT